jgi:hypothetical protein
MRPAAARLFLLHSWGFFRFFLLLWVLSTKTAEILKESKKAVIQRLAPGDLNLPAASLKSARAKHFQGITA